MPGVNRKADSDNLEKLAKNSDRILKNRRRDLVITSSVSGVIGAVVGYLLNQFII